MGRRTVQWTTAARDVQVGNSNSRYGKCALLERSGRKITTFVLSPGQERSLKAGKKISITSQAVERAEAVCGGYAVVPGAGGRPTTVWNFETGSGLSGARRRRRRAPSKPARRRSRG